MSDILFPQHAPLRSEEIVPQLRRALAGRVEAAYLFGSVAVGAARPGSDLDLILVQQTTRGFFERGEDFFDIFDLVPADLDLLVYTPQEFSRLTTDPAPGFWQDVVHQLLRIM